MASSVARLVAASPGAPATVAGIPIDRPGEGTAWMLPVFALVAPIALAFGLGPMAVLVTVAGLGLASLGLVWEALVALLVGTMFFLGPLKIGYGGWIAYAIPDSLGALVLLRWLAAELAHGATSAKRHPLLAPFFCLVLYLVIEIVNPTAPLLRSVFGFRSWVMYTIFVFVGYEGFRSLTQIVRLYRVLILLGTITGAYGIWQWREGPSALIALGGSYVWYADLLGVAPWESESAQVFRAVSTFMSATMFASNMAMGILLAFSLLLWRGSGWFWRCLYLGAITVMGGSIATSGSRMGVVYVAGALLAGGYLFGSLRLLAVALPLGFIAIYVGDMVTMGAMAARFQTLFEPETYFWKWFNPLWGGLGIGIEYPMGRGLGYAAGMPSFADDELIRDMPAGTLNTIDSGYGMVAAELGIIGLPIFVWFAWAVAMAALRAWRALPPEARRLLFAPAVWAFAFPVFTILGAPHASLPHSAYFWLLIGMFLRAGTLADAERRSPA